MPLSEWVPRTWLNGAGPPFVGPTALNAIELALQALSQAVIALQTAAVVLPAGVVVAVYKTGSTWPARPSTSTSVTYLWVGAEPSPPIVSTGTSGMYAGDLRAVTVA